MLPKPEGINEPGAVSYDEASGVLIVRDGDYSGDHIVALDLRPGSERPPRILWQHDSISAVHSRGRTNNLGPGGLCVIPRLGIAAYAHYFADALVVLRVVDGAVLQVLSMHRPLYVAALPLLGSDSGATVYVSSEGENRVVGVRFDSQDFSVPAVVSEPLVRANPAVGHGNPALAVIPPSPGSSSWHLVVGDYNDSRLRVLALPSGEVVYQARGRDYGGDAPEDFDRHSSEEGTRVYAGTVRPLTAEASRTFSWSGIRGLAADPSGAALLFVGNNHVRAVPFDAPLDASGAKSQWERAVSDMVSE